MSLTIEHTTAEGTLLLDTTRGDGSAEVVKALGWRWSRSLGAWFVPRSRDRAPRRDLIDTTADALRKAEHEVTVHIDATVADPAEAEARRAERAEARTARLQGRAEREEKEAERHDAAGRRIAAGIPLGQPILKGHHSQPRAERDHRRLAGHFDASVQHSRNAEEARRAAQIAAASTDARNAPVTVGNRIERLAADERKLTRSLEGLAADAPWAAARREELEHLRADLAYWRQVREQQIADGTATNYGRETVRKGDAVKIGGTWHRVERANAKTVAVPSGYGWTNNAPWHQVTDHRPAADGGAS